MSLEHLSYLNETNKLYIFQYILYLNIPKIKHFSKRKKKKKREKNWKRKQERILVS